VAFLHLKKSQYFFSDIKKEGITLYDSGKFQLEEAVELDNKQRYQIAKDDFEYYFERGKKLIKLFNFSFNDKDYRESAFLLHQVTERLYTCILLVFTRYKPNTHKLDILRKLTNALDKRLIKIFPLTTQKEIDRFTLLCQAYVDARYNKSYTITKEELSWLNEKVQELTQLTEILCQEKINSFLV
jgi:HEPN domain-containing protein